MTVTAMRPRPEPGARTKAQAFRALLASPELAFLCEAHNGLSARIAEEAGFKGLWASGLAVSAALGVRDNNEASWTQVLEVVEFMADATSVPIMLDGDTGYGNFNNMRRLVRKLESRGVAAVCIEDKLFPKTNSFIAGANQGLADIDEFCGKIRAGKEAQRDPDFSIVARCEAFIAGWGLDEALRRAEAYSAAGADAILIHSARRTPDEVLAFLDAWDGRKPVVLVPTKYYTTPTELFRAHGAAMVIWANHLVRAAIAAMERAARTLNDEESVLALEDSIAPVAEVFRLQGADELERAEKVYLPQAPAARAIVLAAARGRELGELTEALPKAMLPVAGKPLLAHIAAAYRQAGVKDITVVRGFAKDRVALSGVGFVDNDAYETTQELASLAAALDARKDSGALVVSYGDVLFRRHLLDMLADALAPQSGAPAPIAAVVVDTNWQESRNRGPDRRPDYVRCSLPFGREAYSAPVWLEAMGAGPGARIDGEWMGLVRFTPAGAGALRAAVEDWRADDARGFAAAGMSELLTRMAEAGARIKVVYTTGHWLDIDHVDDLVLAGSFV
jgi:phosphoenolpyruvate phosphomutase